ncbi:MAG: amino acid aminotransferase [Bythopirellula sp.]|nr:amino acid aminotransferase [Bythopirellula sp.]
MLETVKPAPADAILGLTVAFNKDARPEKINLSVGIYQDENGKTPTLASVSEAEQRLAAGLSSKTYLPISGSEGYLKATQQLAFGAKSELPISGRMAGAHTPGGTGGLRVVADFLHESFPQATVWLSDPTWPNHQSIFAAAGLATKTYPYFDQAANSLKLDAMLAAISTMAAGDVILLHGCCHNPTGIDPTPVQWKQIVAAVNKQGVLPFLDFAYQGFGDGLEEDSVALREFAQAGGEFIVCSSFSKNFGLYRERVGAVAFVCKTAQDAGTVQSQINRAVRANYSNPPAHGAAIVETILNDPELRGMWEAELATMRDRINGMRSQLVETLAEKGVPGDYSFIKDQRGMFSFSGLTKDQVELLRDEYAIYIVGSGRINVAGLTPANIDRVAESIGAVVGQPA